MPKYKKIVLKVSGEALAGNEKSGIDVPTVKNMAKEIKKIQKLGVQVSIVVGGGNFWRGRDDNGITRTTSDYMGMLGTVMNGLALRDTLIGLGVKARVQSALDIEQMVEAYSEADSMEYLEDGNVLIFVAGIGNPYFSTDTAAALRAAQIGAEVILSGKKGVDGVYSADPNIEKDAVKFDKLSYMDILNKDLKIMDSTATSLCMDNSIPLIVFGIDDLSNMLDVVLGKDIGTIIKEE